MVRNYKPKSERGRGYSKEDLRTATEEVISGRMNTYRASKLYSIPYFTLRDHVKGRRGVKSNTGGRPYTFPPDVEKIIATGILEMEKYGSTLSREELLSLIQEYVKCSNMKTPFKNGRPGYDWLYGFMKRHRMSIKKPQSVEAARKNCIDPFVIYPYFKSLEQTIKDLKLEDKPHLIFNLDETSFARDPSKTKVVGGKGLPATRTTSSSGSDNISVLLTVGANGRKLPPLVIFKGSFIWDEWQPPPEEAFPGLTYAATKNGWMEAEVFANFFLKSFLRELGEERTALIICDGHSTHVSLKFIEMARREKVSVLLLPPHSSHLLQPLDLSVMKSIKNAWDIQLVQWQKHHIGQRLPKKEFVKILSKVWTDLDPNVIVSGFRKGGIMPTDRNVIPTNMFNPITLERWREEQSQQNSMLTDNTEGPSSRPPQESLTSISDLPLLTGETSFSHQDICSSTSGSSLLLFHPSTINNSPSVIEKSTQQEKKSFQELLLATIASHKATYTKPRKTKVALGSEVITSNETYERLLVQQREKEDMDKLKEAKKAEKLQKKNIRKASENKKRKNIAKKQENKANNKKKLTETSSSDSDDNFSLRDSDEEDFDIYADKIAQQALEEEEDERGLLEETD